MWTLWIVSSVIGSTEPKVTRYAEFETTMSCYIEQAIVEENFTQGETAFCEGYDIPYTVNRTARVLSKDDTRRFCLWGIE